MEWEFQILYTLQRIHNPVLDGLMVFFSTIGDAGIFWIALTILLLFIKKYRAIGWQMAAAMLITFVIGNLILKNLVARERPCWLDTSVILLVSNPQDFSFPSGHSMNGFTASTVLFLNDRRLGIWAVILAAVIAFSRLYNFVHFPTDVLVGMMIGILVGVAVCLGYKQLSSKRNVKGQF